MAERPSGDAADVIGRLGRHRGWILAFGVITLLAGVAALAWPGVTILVLAVLFGAQLVVAGIFRFGIALGSDDLTGGSRALLAMLGVLSFVVGLYALRHVLLTIVVLALLLGIFWVVNGAVEIFAALSHRAMPARGWIATTGALSIVAGVIALAIPGLSLVALAILMGVWLVVLTQPGAKSKSKQAPTRLRRGARYGSARWSLDGCEQPPSTTTDGKLASSDLRAWLKNPKAIDLMSRAFHPEFLSPDVLTRPDFGEACAGRDLGAILGIAIRWGGPGFSVSHVARRCEMTASQVTDYVRRGRRATRLDVFERVADGLRIPGHMLGITGRPWENSRPGQLDETAPGTAQAVAAAYSGRGSITRMQWNQAIGSAGEHVWLYGMAEFGYATDAEVPGLLAGAAGRGCEIQILLLDPEYGAAAAIDEDEGSPPGTLSTRIRASLARFGRMREECGESFGIRIYDAHPSVSLVRGDDRILVTPYLRFFTGSNSPTFEFRAGSANKIFDRYEGHFRRAWELSKDWI